MRRAVVICIDCMMGGGWGEVAIGIESSIENMSEMESPTVAVAIERLPDCPKEEIDGLLISFVELVVEDLVVFIVGYKHVV